MDIDTINHKYIWIDLVLNNELNHLKWVNDNLSEWYSEDILDLASEHGNMEIVKFLVENGKHCTTDAMDLAAKRGHLNILIYLHEKGFNCTDYAMTYAAAYNHFNIVKWLYENRTEGDIGVANYWAFKNDHYWFEDYVNHTLSYKEKKHKEINKISKVLENIKI